MVSWPALRPRPVPPLLVEEAGTPRSDLIPPPLLLESPTREVGAPYTTSASQAFNRSSFYLAMLLFNCEKVLRLPSLAADVSRNYSDVS